MLLVDDSATVLLLHQGMLLELGYEAVTARNGLEALARAETERPDLVFLDVVMPHLDGLETCRALRAREPTRNTPIILCSTRTRAAQRAGRLRQRLHGLPRQALRWRGADGPVTPLPGLTI